MSIIMWDIQVSQAHKFQLGRDWFLMDHPYLDYSMAEADPVLCVSFPKKFITRHTWLQWDVGLRAFYSGDCGLRIELPSPGQMDPEGLRSSTAQVTI